MSPVFASDVLAEIAALRALLAVPPPLDEVPDGVMLAVASVPGKLPEEWQEAYPLWMAWPHAAGAVYAVEMTAAQLRARLAAMEAG